MTQASVAKSAYRMKVALPWVIYLTFATFLTSVITFLVFTGMSTNTMKDAPDNGTTQSGVFNSAHSFYREVSYQATVISLLTIITFCVVYHTFKVIV